MDTALLLYSEPEIHVIISSTREYNFWRNWAPFEQNWKIKKKQEQKLEVLQSTPIQI